MCVLYECLGPWRSEEVLDPLELELQLETPMWVPFSHLSSPELHIFEMCSEIIFSSSSLPKEILHLFSPQCPHSPQHHSPTLRCSENVL